MLKDTSLFPQSEIYLTCIPPIQADQFWKPADLSGNLLVPIIVWNWKGLTENHQIKLPPSPSDSVQFHSLGSLEVS